MIESGIRLKTAFNDAVKKACRRYRREEATAVCYLLFEDIFGFSRLYIHTNPDERLDSSLSLRLNEAMELLETGMPVQYITGVAWFGDLKLAVAPGVLIPRQETAELPSIIWQDWRQSDSIPSRIIDIGTGSGCLAIALARMYQQAEVYAIDNSSIALGIAESNAARLGCIVQVVHGDILAGLQTGPTGKFDIIVSNPPYVTESEKDDIDVQVKNFEPHTALFVSDRDPYIYYEAIARFAMETLTHAGRLYVEINEKFGREICQIFSAYGLENTLIYKDINGKDRFIRAFSAGS